MYPIFKFLPIFFFTFIGFFNDIFAQSSDELVTAINQQLIPLRTLSPDDDFNDLQKLKVILKDKQIISMGEATHGTREFFLFKHRMLEFLIKEVGIKTFIIEADFAGTQILNDYVIYGKGDVEQAIRKTGFGIWMTQEFVEMINWLKAYNATQSSHNKVRVFGCDMQFGFLAMQTLKEYLVKYQQLTPEMNIGFEASNKYAPSLTEMEKKAIQTTVTALAHIQFTDKDTVRMAMYKHTVRQLEQFLDYLDAKSTFYPTKQSDLRDKYMAENCEWIYNQTGKSKMMIWAHNEHIKKSQESDGHQRMGMFLKETFKDNYYAMGFDFNSGKMRSYSVELKKNVTVELPEAKNGSSGALFAKSSSSNFILDFKSASANPVINLFLKSKIPSSWYGAAYIKGQSVKYVTNKLAEAYDAIIFISDTHAASDIKRP